MEYDEDAPLLLENAALAAKKLPPPKTTLQLPETGDDDATEEEDEDRPPQSQRPSSPARGKTQAEVERSPARKNSPPKAKRATRSPEPARSQVDRGVAPGRIIGSTYPLEDFRGAIAQGDIVTKAVEDLGVVMKEIVLKPFANRRKQELLDCLKFLRETCLKVRNLPSE